MIGKFLFLGTGASTGVPQIGCKCVTCLSGSPQNLRLRTAGFIKIGHLSLLIDVGPDFRQQALRYKIDHVDGLLVTHTHFDHIAGIDELRIFYLKQKKPLPCLLSQESLNDLKTRYAYLFRPIESESALSAQMDMHILPKEDGEIDFLGLKIHYCSYFQGGMKVSGFRFGDFAYISDIKKYEESIFQHLRGVKQLVVSALLEETSPFHFSLNDAIEFSKKIGAQETYVTHISHHMNYETVSSKLPPNVKLGTDGMEVTFEY